jgi:hypothetical protein
MEGRYWIFDNLQRIGGKRAKDDWVGREEVYDRLPYARYANRFSLSTYGAL